MDCPVCRTSKLVISERQGIEIDYCPDCRGVWLDRGELDKIIDRSAQPGVPDRSDYGDRRHHDDHHRGYKKKRKEGFLGDLFDF